MVVIQAIISTFVRYKFFSVPFIAMLIILLMRIPLGTFSQASVLDSVAHFILPATAGVLLYVLLVHGMFLPAMRQSVTVFSIILLGVFIEVLWEIFEYIVDLTLHLGWQLGNADTMDDLILAVLGSLLAGLIFVRCYQSD